MSDAPLRFLAEPDVRAKLGGISRVTLWHIRRNPDAGFPSPVVLAGTRLLRWSEPDVDAWISRSARRMARTLNRGRS